MSNSHQRTERLIADRKAVSVRKQKEALEALSKLVEAGEIISFTTVYKAAGVSSWFVYNNEIVRSAVKEEIRKQTLQQRMEPQMRTDSRTVRGLRTELANARSEINELRKDRERLRHYLQRNLGDQLEKRRLEELPAKIQQLKDSNMELSGELEVARAALKKCEQERDEAKANAEGAHLALRQMMKEV